MGQKVNPIGLRVGINRTWDSRWYANKTDFADLLHEDIAIRNFIFTRLKQAGVSKVIIERPAKKARISIHSARPGVVIGKKGQDIEKLKNDLQKMTKSEVQVNIIEIRKPEIDAKLVADNIAQQLERTYGVCGLKVWIFKGEIMAHDPLASERKALESAGSGRK